jgi:hypothetical protein
VAALIAPDTFSSLKMQNDVVRIKENRELVGVVRRKRDEGVRLDSKNVKGWMEMKG